MVNFAPAFGLQNKNNILAIRDMNMMRSQFDPYKKESCDEFNHPFPSQQELPQQMEFNIEVQSTPNLQMKPSPSFMDADVQFNFPSCEQQDRSKYNSHVVAETKCQSFPASTVSDGCFPALQRQYSINTVLEVIESHDINDSASFNSAETNSCRNPQTHPMNIHSSIVPPNVVINQPNPRSTQTNDPQQVTVLAAPASDRLQGSSLSSSPGCLPFTRYQSELNHVPSPSSQSQVRQMTCAPTTKFHSNYAPEASAMVTEDQMSPYPVFSPTYSCEMESPALVGNSVQEQPHTNQVFTFDNYPNRSVPSQPTPDFNYSTPQQFIPQPTPPVCTNVTYNPPTQYHQPPPPYNLDLMTVDPTTSINNSDMSISNSFQLEEVDQKVLPDDVRSLSPTPISEQEKLDQKRIRNNQACRASRERRKKRKAETEALADKLQDDNRRLKEQILQLEKEVKSAQQIVQRRMSQNCSTDCQLPFNFDSMHH